MITTAHRHHEDVHPMRIVLGRPGVYVYNHGDWDRPMHVWLYRGAWRAVCRPCVMPITSDDTLTGYGWRTMVAAYDAAVAHCRNCGVTA